MLHALRLLFLLLAAGLAGCATTAPPPPAPPVREAPPPRRPPAPAPEPRDESPPAPVVKSAYRPVPEGVFESQSFYPRAEVTVWHLASGARVVFHRTLAAPRRISVLGFAPGGLGSAPDTLLTAAIAAPSVVQPTDADIAEQVLVRITEQDAQVVGSGSTDMLERVLRQLVEAMTDVQPSGAAQPSSNVVLDALLSGVPHTALIARPDPDEALAFYEQQFGDPRRFTFVLVGDATVEQVERAIADVLPDVRPAMRAVLAEAPERAPWRVPTEAVTMMLAPQRGVPRLTLAFRGRAEPTYPTLAGLYVLAEQIEGALAVALPDAAVVVAPGLDFEAGVAELRVTLAGADVAENAVRIRAVEAITAVGSLSSQALAVAREAARAQHLAQLATHAGWLDWLTRALRYDHDTAAALQFKRDLLGVTAARVHRLAEAVLHADQVVSVAQPSE
ncbi:MAG: hypothetical protein HKN04_04375 [Rhodothermaceae bacterium]|nr:hypothetical protein [Rhodothermaceae bacterium]